MTDGGVHLRQTSNVYRFRVVYHTRFAGRSRPNFRGTREFLHQYVSSARETDAIFCLPVRRGRIAALA